MYIILGWFCEFIIGGGDLSISYRYLLNFYELSMNRMCIHKILIFPLQKKGIPTSNKGYMMYYHLYTIYFTVRFNAYGSQVVFCIFFYFKIKKKKYYLLRKYLPFFFLSIYLYKNLILLFFFVFISETRQDNKKKTTENKITTIIYLWWTRIIRDQLEDHFHAEQQHVIVNVIHTYINIHNIMIITNPEILMDIVIRIQNYVMGRYINIIYIYIYGIEELQKKCLIYNLFLILVLDQAKVTDDILEMVL